jgi:hypothetical protein
MRAWLGTVLRNLWVSNRRQRARRQQALEVVAGREHDPGVTRDLAPRPEPLSDTDLGRLEKWACRRRVEVLCLAGLWPYAPAPRWASWLVEYERLRSRDLGRPFPLDDVLFCDEPADRLRPLAQALGYSPNTLAVRWLRSKHCLKELDFIRELEST